MANCDIPDLDIFPDRYGIDVLRFSLLELRVMLLIWVSGFIAFGAHWVTN